MNWTVNFVVQLKGILMRSRFLSARQPRKRGHDQQVWSAGTRQWFKCHAAKSRKTVDDSWSTDWSSLIKFSYLFYSGQVKILVNDLGTLMILDTKTNSLSAYKLLQLLRRLTGWAMMAADDIDWSWERSDNTHQRIPGAGPSWAPAGKSRWRRKQCCRFSTAQHREETDWRRKLEAWIFNGALVAKGAKFQWKIQLDHFASPFVTHSSASQSGNQIYITLGEYPDFCPKIPEIQFG